MNCVGSILVYWDKEPARSVCPLIPKGKYTTVAKHDVLNLCLREMSAHASLKAFSELLYLELEP